MHICILQTTRVNYFIYTLTLFLSVFCYGQEKTRSFIYTDSKESLYIGEYAEYIEDKGGDLNLEDLSGKKFIPFETKVPNLELSSSYYWVRFSVQNNSESDDLRLTVENPGIDDVCLYQPDSNGYSKLHLGEFRNFHERPYPTPNYVFDLDLKRNETKMYFLRVAARETLVLPVRINSATESDNREANTIMYGGIYFGVMLVMILYNLFIAFSVKDRTYFYYVFCITSVMAAQASLQGHFFQFVVPGFPEFARLAPFIFPAMANITALLFMIEFLKLQEQSKRLYYFALFLLIPFIVSILLAFSGIYAVSFKMMEMSAMIDVIYMLYTGWFVLRRGFRPARFFILGWTVFLIGVLIYVLKDFAVLPYNGFTRYTMQIGSALETVLLSFALASRINVYRKEKEEMKRLQLQSDNELLDLQLKSMGTQINSHFLFNSLNSVNYYILKNDQQKATDYLSKFSRLIRTVLQGSIDGTTTISEEVEMLKNYLVLEQNRFKTDFSFEVTVHPDVEEDNCKIAALMVQPFVENAIWHGLQPLEDRKGKIFVDFQYADNARMVLVTVLDNGIGRKQSQLRYQKLGIDRKSVGMDLTKRRLEIINDLQTGNVEITDLKDRNGDPLGTKVELKLIVQ